MFGRRACSSCWCCPLAVDKQSNARITHPRRWDERWSELDFMGRGPPVTKSAQQKPQSPRDRGSRVTAHCERRGHWGASAREVPRSGVWGWAAGPAEAKRGWVDVETGVRDSNIAPPLCQRGERLTPPPRISSGRARTRGGRGARRIDRRKTRGLSARSPLARSRRGARADPALRRG